MRLHRLTMTAIGPYAGTELIDFDRFAGSGRFLLTGPTGAGKSTIIDAIVFALYGQVADADGSSRQRIRSTLVEGSVHSEVDLVFSTSAGTYRVLRSPEYQRPKKRGNGLTKENASVRLWRLSSPEGQPLGEPLTRVDEVGQEVARVVGLSREQLTQTVVLPQGRFAQFLRATSQERHDLLRDVFGTAVFDALQEELRERGREVQRQGDEARRNLRAQADLLTPLLPPAPQTQGAGSSCEEAVSAQAVAAHEEGLAASGEGSRTFPAALEPTPSSQPASQSSSGAPPLDASALDASDPQPPALPPAERLAQLVELVAPDQSTVQAVQSLGEEALEASRSSLAPLKAALEDAAEARRQSAAELESVLALRARLDRRESLLAEQHLLEETSVQDRDDAKRLAAARRAATVTAFLTRHRRAAQACQDAGSQALLALREALLPLREDQSPDGDAAALLEELLERAEAGVTALTPLDGNDLAAETFSQDTVEKHAPVQVLTAEVSACARSLEEVADDARTQAGALSTLVSTEAGLAERRQTLENRRSTLLTQDEDVSTQAKVLEARPAQQELLEQALSQAREALAALPALRLSRDTLEVRHKAALRAQTLQDQLGEAEQTVERARMSAQEAGTVVARRRRAWISATAATLVHELEENEPCPVCGGTEHPAPASPEPGSVSRADVEAAEALQHQADDALAAAARTRSELSAQIEAALAAAGQESTEALIAQLEQARSALAQQESTGAQAGTLTTRLEGFNTATQQMREALETARLTYAQNQAQLKEQDAALAADAAHCESSCEGYPSVDARQQALTQHALSTERIARSLREAVSCALALEESYTELSTALDGAGFSSAQEALDAALAPSDLTQLEKEVTAVTARRERVEHGLTQDPEISVLTGQEVADVTQTREHLATAEAEHTARLTEYQRSLAGHAQLENAVEAVTGAAQNLLETIQDSAALAQVVAVATGRNEASTPLATWVLLERFNDVLTFANNRLAQMSSGRYELVRVEDEAGSAGRRDRGLGLGVVDRFSGEGVRDPRTLSGGETFYVSLSLALALADVVSAESGGITMETLFVDEGFGSLDPETLQDVLAELGRLQDGGRTVGIVSHVEELRRQVPDRIEVTKTPTGSRLQVTAS